MQRHDIYRLSIAYVFFAGYVAFCAYGFTSMLCFSNSVISLGGSVGCLAGYAKFAYHSSKEDKKVG